MWVPFIIGIFVGALTAVAFLGFMAVVMEEYDTTQAEQERQRRRNQQNNKGGFDHV